MEDWKLILLSIIIFFLYCCIWTIWKSWLLNNVKCGYVLDLWLGNQIPRTRPVFKYVNFLGFTFLSYSKTVLGEVTISQDANLQYYSYNLLTVD